MKKADAALKFCPLIRDKCMTDSCMAWSETINKTPDEVYGDEKYLIEEIDILIRGGFKIDAIKELRSRLSLTLKDAKYMVDFNIYPTMIKQFYKAKNNSGDQEENGHCSKLNNTLGKNESPNY